MIMVFCHGFLRLASCNQPYWQFSIFHNQLWPEWPILETDNSHQLTDSFVSKQTGNKQTGFPCTIFHPQIMSLPGQIHLMFKDFQSKAFCGLNSVQRHRFLCAGLHCDWSCTQHHKIVFLIFFLSRIFIYSGSMRIYQCRRKNKAFSKAAGHTHIPLCTGSIYEGK